MIPIPRPPSPVQLGADFGRRVSGDEPTRMNDRSSSYVPLGRIHTAARVMTGLGGNLFIVLDTHGIAN